MPSILLPRRFYSQPPGFSRAVDDASFSICGANPTDSVTGVVPTRNAGVSIGTTPLGPAIKFNGTQADGACSWGDLDSVAVGATSLSLEILFYITGNGKPFAKWGLSNTVEFLAEVNSGNIIFGIGNGAFVQAVRTGGSLISANVLNHVVCVWNGGMPLISNGNIYINGVGQAITAVAATGSFTSIANTANIVQLGRAGDGGNMTGGVLLARVYRRALGSAEAKNRFYAMFSHLRVPE